MGQSWRELRATRAVRSVSIDGMPQMTLRPFADGPKTEHIGGKSAHRLRDEAVDARIAALAEQQWGLVSLAQLEKFGLSEVAVQRRAERGRLHRAQQGVYSVGIPVSGRHAEFMAAVLATGPDAVVSHRSAAELWKFLGLVEGGDIDITAANRRGRSPVGVAAHRDTSLKPVDRATVAGIPCTSAERTILDLAGIVPVPILRRAIGEAEVLRVLDHDRMRRLIRRGGGRRGVARLRLVLDQIHPQAKRSRSELERLFLEMCVRAALPEPEVNVEVIANGRLYRPDFLWREARLIVEADSRRFHDTYSAFQADRGREQNLMVAGWRVTRCSWEQVETEPRSLAATIRKLLDDPQPMGRKPNI